VDAGVMPLQIFSVLMGISINNMIGVILTLHGKSYPSYCPWIAGGSKGSLIVAIPGSSKDS